MKKFFSVLKDGFDGKTFKSTLIFYLTVAPIATVILFLIDYLFGLRVFDNP